MFRGAYGQVHAAWLEDGRKVAVKFLYPGIRGVIRTDMKVIRLALQVYELFVPVENIEVLSRYGSEGEGVGLDRLGQGNWQARKSRIKDRIREIAGELIKVAAARALMRNTDLSAEDITRNAMAIAGEICIYSNDNLSLLTLDSSGESK